MPGDAPHATVGGSAQRRWLVSCVGVPKRSLVVDRDLGLGRASISGFEVKVVRNGVLGCHLRDGGDIRVLTDVGAFWLSQSQGRSVLSYRTLAQPANLRNLPDTAYVVPKEPRRWLLCGPPSQPLCGIDPDS